MSVPFAKLITNHEVLCVLEETGPFKTLAEICAELASRWGEPVTAQFREEVLTRLRDLERNPSLVEARGDGEHREWKIHFLK